MRRSALVLVFATLCLNTAAAGEWTIYYLWGTAEGLAKNGWSLLATPPSAVIAVGKFAVLGACEEERAAVDYENSSANIQHCRKSADLIRKGPQDIGSEANEALVLACMAQREKMLPVTICLSGR